MMIGSPAVAGTSPRQRRKALAAAGFGTIIEFFDYAVYSYLATVIAVVFFPPADTRVALIQTFAVFALSFAMRPLAGLFWGHYGDRLGRRKTLLLTVSGMGTATLVIGLLPAYAAVGGWAPLFLVCVRMLQSFCTAGVYSSAAVIAGEFAPPGRRARYVSVVPMGCAAGFMLASAMVGLLHGSLHPDQMVEWGWRVPFIAGGVLTFIGFIFQRAFEETPDFQLAQIEDSTAQSPVSRMLRQNWGRVLALLFIVGVNHAGYYIIIGYMSTYLQMERGFSAASAGYIATIGLVAYLPMLYMCATLSDWFGRRKLLFASSFLFLLLSYPAFVALGSGGFATALMVQLLLMAILALNDATVSTYFVESFPTNVRLSGFAVPFNVSAVLFGGVAPLFAEWLIVATGNSFAPAFIMMGVAALSLPALFASPETAPFRHANSATVPLAPNTDESLKVAVGSTPDPELATHG